MCFTNYSSKIDCLYKSWGELACKFHHCMYAGLPSSWLTKMWNEPSQPPSWVLCATFQCGICGHLWIWPFVNICMAFCEYMMYGLYLDRKESEKFTFSPSISIHIWPLSNFFINTNPHTSTSTHAAVTVHITFLLGANKTWLVHVEVLNRPVHHTLLLCMVQTRRHKRR